MRFSFEIVGVTRSPVQKLALQPIDPSNLSSFATSSVYNIQQVLSAFDPAVLGAMPEQPICIYVLEILDSITNQGSLPDFTQYQVIMPEFSKTQELQTIRAVESCSQKLALILARIIEIQAIVPDMKALESSWNYCRNGLGMGLTVKVVAQAGVETKPSLPFPVWLPLPYLGSKLIWDEGSGTVGYRELPPGGHVEDVANFLGEKAVPDAPPHPSEADLARLTDTPGGQIRWYSVDQGAMTLKRMLGMGNSANPDPYPHAPQGQLALTLPAEAQPKLAEMRHTGRWLYNECDLWTDDNFHVTLPKEAGYLVVWRDDLPSRPIQCLDPEKYLHDLVVNLARQLWGLTGASTDSEIRIPVPVGQVIQLAVQRLQDAVNNELVNLLGTSGLNVQFAFLTSPYTDDVHPQSGFDPAHFSLPPGADGSLLQSIGSSVNSLLYRDVFEPQLGGQALDLLYEPQVIEEGVSDPAWRAFAVQLQVAISGKITFHDFEIDLNDVEPMAVGPRLIFIPEPLRLPTMAVFFSDSYFAGKPLVLLPANSGLFPPDFHFDFLSQGDFNEVRNTIVNKLNDVHHLLQVAHAFWSNDTLGLILNVLGSLVAAGRIVVDATGTVENLSDCVVEKHIIGYGTWNDAISSVVLLGPPHAWSHTVIKCYQHSMRRPDWGLCLRLLLPDSSFIAAIPSFVRLRETYSINGFTVPLACGDPPSTGIFNFNDQVTGVEFVTEG